MAMQFGDRQLANCLKTGQRYPVAWHFLREMRLWLMMGHIALGGTAIALGC
jgi:hypothetical protein